MLFFGILSIVLAVASAEFCYSDVEGACSNRPTSNDGALIPNCNAKYGAIDLLQADLQSYANANIESSFEYLLMSTYFGNYVAQREGFKDLYRKLSDKTWEDAIDLIKYIAKRGGRMNFNQLPRFKKTPKESRVLELNELSSLAKALDTQKQLAEEAMRIHGTAQAHNKHDAALGHYMEEQFFESHTKSVRDLAGYTSDLKQLLTERDPSVSVFLFDEILKKSL
ncbi:ferritin, lower subunit [Hylaeus anthracinus]|uniref:ferritin, lower subunit n=1 Tax=Hylaeus volcanicus TaxID=313075 RepID=UPI0023B84524|nr:ferritin, lower subunit [Hylaeus volcanicus]XP_053974282.1 ferritin, lower subunit [Hylaeus volcanicus]XP_053996294.1 ferritin, lower subunit [Hylaeus anthracinus]XP_053996296.1 ferritin, lower subunit [Hylaeus anthracinus]